MEQSINDKYIIYDFQKHIAESEESFLGLGIMKNNEKSWFEFMREPFRTESYDKENMMFAFEIRLTPDVVYHTRAIYTFLDLLGDVGGLLDALKGFMSFVVAIYFHICGDPIQAYLLKSLFVRNPHN